MTIDHPPATLVRKCNSSAEYHDIATADYDRSQANTVWSTHRRSIRTQFAARERYLSSYENSRSWVDFKDFGFYRLEPLDIYQVGGFGVMGWVTADDYRTAKVDSLAEAAPRILGHMNANHVPAMILLARVHSNLEASEATMTAVDRLGFHLRLKTAEGMKGTRINFLREVRSADETRKILVEMVRAAESKPS